MRVRFTQVSLQQSFNRQIAICSCFANLQIFLVLPTYRSFLFCQLIDLYEHTFLPMYYCFWPNDRKLLNILQASSKSRSNYLIMNKMHGILELLQSHSHMSCHCSIPLFSAVSLCFILCNICCLFCHRMSILLH